MPLTFVDVEKFEKVTNENGHEVKQSCETRQFARNHPEDLSSDSILLMSHQGNSERLITMDLLKMNSSTQCKAITPDTHPE